MTDPRLVPASRRTSSPRSLLLALAASILVAGGARSLEELEGRLDALRARWDVPGMSAAMARDGNVVWERGFGSADLEAGRPQRPLLPLLAHGSPSPPELPRLS